MSATPGIVWLGPVFDPSGYADEARGILGALDGAKVPVAVRPMERVSVGFREGLPAAERAILDRLIAQPLPKSYVMVQHVTADGFYRASSVEYMVGRTMFETDSLPPTWVEPANAMDELWLPSAFNAETFRRAGVTVPIHLVPGGIDSTTYCPEIAPLPIAGLRGTIFLSVFEWRLRKGWDVLLRAWVDAFTPADDVTLVIRTYPIDRADGRDNLTIINEQIAQFLHHSCGGRTRTDVAPIVVLPDKIAARDMPALYRIAHAYVSPTRGEGWGRPFMEAMASGVPVIATRWSAHLAFLNDENGYLIDLDDVGPADGIEVPLYAEQQWANPSAAHLTQLLQRVHGDPGEARAVGTRARADMVRDWPWSRAADAIRGRLRQIAGHQAFLPAVPSAPSTADRQLRLAARLFDGNAWHYPSEQLASAVAEFSGAACVVHNSADHALRPSWSDRVRPAWQAMQRHDRDTTASDITLTFLSRDDVHEVIPPTHGAWIVYTGDVVADTVPSEWVRTLRDQATEVWTPTHDALNACLRVGVDPDRLWQAPFVTPNDRCPPDGPRMPIEGRAGQLVLYPVFDEQQEADLARLVEAWPTSALACDTATLLVLLPNEGTRRSPRSRDRLLTLLAKGSVEHRVPVRVDGRSLTLEETAAFVRSADVVITSPHTTVRADIVHRLALLFERPAVQLAASGDAAAAQLTLEVTTSGTSSVGRMDIISYDALREQVGKRLSALLVPPTYEVPRTLRTSGVAAAVVPSAHTTRFLAFPDWCSGKGAGIMRSYCETFTADDDVVLVLAEDAAQHVSRDALLRMVNEASQLAGRSADTRPPIVLLPDAITAAAREALLAACQVVVGFDDPPLAHAARRIGMPVVQTLLSQVWRQRQADAIKRAARPPKGSAPPTSS
ncbi:glycosyltransferase family 4 protein [Gemmatimonas sp.]|uniref:glycosyltransferase family 4 protein n=1 Tax=Gemmatimonas sp. TaxID=1962908 RepID=UPI003982F2E3